MLSVVSMLLTELLDIKPDNAPRGFDKIYDELIDGIEGAGASEDEPTLFCSGWFG